VFSEWLSSVNAPTSLGELGIGDGDVERLTAHALHQAGIWNITRVYSEDVISRIYGMAL
jgi:glycerol dehydrogenase-like iron-containing ADH family enzyme